MLKQTEQKQSLGLNGPNLTLVLIDGLGELVESGGDLQSLKKNSLLTLDANVLWPLDEASEISLGLDVTANSKVTSFLLEKRALNSLRPGLSTTAGSNNLLANLLDLYHEIDVRNLHVSD